jgi:hypothetical protein
LVWVLIFRILDNRFGGINEKLITLLFEEVRIRFGEILIAIYDTSELWGIILYVVGGGLK